MTDIFKHKNDYLHNIAVCLFCYELFFLQTDSDEFLFYVGNDKNSSRTFFDISPTPMMAHITENLFL